MPIDPRFNDGVQTFNQRSFFEAHQIWEKIWLDDDSPTRDFYKGLIQIALCLHHFTRGNTRGARKLYNSCRRYLNGLRPRHRGVDLDQLMSDLQECCAELAASQEETPGAQLDPELIPQVVWEPPNQTAS